MRPRTRSAAAATRIAGRRRADGRDGEPSGLGCMACASLVSGSGLLVTFSSLGVIRFPLTHACIGSGSTLEFSCTAGESRRLCNRLKTAGTKIRVATVAQNRPPMTARPSGAFCSPPSPNPIAIGTMPMIMARAVISTGRNRVNPAFSAAPIASLPSVNCSLAKLTTRMLLAVATPTQVIEPGLEIHHDQQVHQHNRKEQSAQQPLVGRAHGLNLPANDQLRAAWQFLPAVLHDFVEIARHAAQAPALHRTVNVNQGLDVVVRNHGQSSAAADGCKAGEYAGACAARAGHGNILQTLQGIDP